jgi:hypothetical protein
MGKLSEKMKEAIALAKKQDNCLNKYQLHPKTREALLDRKLIKSSQGYGWGFGALFELTEEGTKIET